MTLVEHFKRLGFELSGKGDRWGDTIVNVRTRTEREAAINKMKGYFLAFDFTIGMIKEGYHYHTFAAKSYGKDTYHGFAVFNHCGELCIDYYRDTTPEWSFP